MGQYVMLFDITSLIKSWQYRFAVLYTEPIWKKVLLFREHFFLEYLS